MIISIASDHAGFEQKQLLAAYLEEKGYEVHDLGPDSDDRVDYPDFAAKVAHEVAGGVATYGVLVCGTGIGMAISANKVPGIRAAQCHDTYSAERASRSNDAQIMTIGARVVGPELAKAIVDSWLNSTFDGGRSQPKVDLISEYEAARRP